MNPLQLIVTVLVLLILFTLINMMMNYVSRRDGEPPVPLKRKLWLVPLLAAFIIVPIELFSILYAMLFRVTDSAGQMLAYNSGGVLLSLPLLLLIGFLLFEGLVHPIMITLLRLWLRRDASVYVKQTVTVITDSILVYAMASVIPAIPVGSWLHSLIIAVFYHLIEWVLIGIQAWIQQRKRAKAAAPG